MRSEPQFADSRKPSLTLSAGRIIVILGGTAIVCVLVQLALGATIVPLFSSIVVCILALAVFWAIGAYVAGAWVLLLYALGNAIVALYAKTALGQPLQSHLYAPDHSFLLILAGTVEMGGALMLAKFVSVGRPLLAAIADPAKLRWLSWSSFVLGSVFWILNEHFRGQGGGGFGGLAMFQALLLMAVISRTAMLLEESCDRRKLDIVLVLIILVATFFGLLENKKTATALPVVSYFTTLLFYQRGLLRRQILFLFVGGIVFVTVLTPLIQAWRYLGHVEARTSHQEISPSWRISQMLSTTEALSNGQRFNRIRSLAQVPFRHGYYNYFGGEGRGQMILGRYASVQQIDPVISETDKKGVIGASVLMRSLARVAPEFLYPEKPHFAESYHILVKLGLRNPKGGKFPTLPLVGQAYAAFGNLGVLVLPFGCFLGFFIAFKKVGWDLRRNVYGIFFFCEFVIVYANQGSLFQYASETLRHFPVFVLTFWLLEVAGRLTAAVSFRPETVSLRE